MTPAVGDRMTPESMCATVQFDDVGAVITLEGKDAAIRLRQKLVCKGIRCTFPAPTWQHADFQFRATRPPASSPDDFAALIIELIHAP